MLDGDHTLEEAWRLRLATFRMYQECKRRSVEYCNHAFNLLKTFEGNAHIWTRVFPTRGAAMHSCANPVQLSDDATAHQPRVVSVRSREPSPRSAAERLGCHVIAISGEC